MKCLLCVDPSDAERMATNATKYLTGASEVVVVCTVDEGGPRGIGLSMRGLLGRRARSSGLEATSESSASEAAERAVTRLVAALGSTKVEARTVSGRPEEEISKLAEQEDFDAVLIGRGNTGPEMDIALSGTVAGFRENHAGDTDGLYLQTDDPEPVEVKFPPHRGREMKRSFSEGAAVEVDGSRRGNSVHAYAVSGRDGKPAVEAHGRPDERQGGLMHVHLGHTARFVTDHVSCDVLLVS